MWSKDETMGGTGMTNVVGNVIRAAKFAGLALALAAAGC
jgi:hypothetical protein